MPHSEGTALERRLSVDEEDGSSSLSVKFVSDWRRQGGVHRADAEYFVLDGELEFGGQIVGKHGYIHAPKGQAVPTITARAGTRILHWRDHGDAGFDVGARTWSTAGDRSPSVVDAAAMEWQAAPEVGPRSPLYVKALHHDDVTGAFTRLFWATEGWRDERLTHHPCFEEVFTLVGRMTYNFGEFEPGVYVFRPAGIKHGHFDVLDPDGCIWIIRSGGELLNYYTEGAWISWDGRAANYDKATDAPAISTLPVRSRSRGDWSGSGM